MKKIIIINLLFLFFITTALKAENPFYFALFSDLHITSSNDKPSEDLINAINDLNDLDYIDFVIVSGDITENGDLKSLKMAKEMLDKLNVPYYITSGNHELKWSESGATDFSRVFGDNKFMFSHKNYHFIAFETGPIIKMGDGHVSPQDIAWVGEQLKQLKKDAPVFAITHYPLQTGDVDNWYEMTDVLRKYNIQAVLGGHYHRNLVFNYDGLPGIINRSTLRGNDEKGAYSIYFVSDTLQVFEKVIGEDAVKWLDMELGLKNYGKPNKDLRPSFEINKQYKNLKEKWRINTGVGIYTMPAVNNKNVYYGDDFGYLNCVSLKKGKLKWKYKTGSRIISSPAVEKDKVVFGSTDGSVYCLNADNGNMIWTFATQKAVMGIPLIENNTVYIGGSDGCFRALDLETGKAIWEFCDVKGYIETRAIAFGDNIYFGAWDTNFYALNKNKGNLVWKWNNRHPRVHFSPAAVLPVASHGKIFITAPDRFWTALDAESGEIVWRTNEHMVRETLGISEDGNIVFSRCMNDSLVALDARSNQAVKIWKTSADYGYDHNPSMLEEKDGVIVFGTKNGLLHGIDAKNGKVLWKYKIGNSIINTVVLLPKNECILSTTEGVVARIKY